MRAAVATPGMTSCLSSMIRGGGAECGGVPKLTDPLKTILQRRKSISEDGRGCSMTTLFPWS